MNQDIIADMTVSASAQRQATISAGKGLKTHYVCEARDPQGRLKWVDEFDNIVVTAGLTDSLDKHFKGSSYNAAWYVGLLSATPTVTRAIRWVRTPAGLRSWPMTGWCDRR